jgi:hypothetical protein
MIAKEKHSIGACFTKSENPVVGISSRRKNIL